jgi:hypothetical protein
MSLPILFLAGQHNSDRIFYIIFSPYYWIFLFCYALLFYSHTYFVFPEWYAKKKYFLYGLYIALFLILIYIVSPFDQLVGLMSPHRQPPPFSERPGGPEMRFPGPPRSRQHFDIISIILFFLTLALSVAVSTSRQLRKSQERALRAETDKAQAELSFLKAQIHPHFLFNTLNNIYSLASGGHENTAPAILKLSNILRYVTEEISNHYVPLDKEISCVKDYIDLQQLRLSNKTTIDFTAEGNFNNSFIPPMVLMTYIENAFKFGVSNHESSMITIRISAADGVIDFICRNKQFSTGKNTYRTGIGLSNTRQRLDYLYKDKYILETDNTNGQYTVKLHIVNPDSDKKGSNGH